MTLTWWSCALLLLLFPSQVAACNETEWFGSNCQYKCRCTFDECDSDGQCTPGAVCEKGWFGPACQYVDLALGREGRYWQATDGDDTTCVPPWAESLMVKLDDSYHFTWLRVHIGKSDFLDDLRVQFNSNLSCVNPRNASVDDTTLDIYCDLNQRVQTVILTGKGVQDLCSVYISGGRNVGLKQNTSQSSTSHSLKFSGFTEYSVYLTSDKAVDGDTSGQVNSNPYSCSHTLNTGTGSNWTVRFSKSQRVRRYVLYNSLDEYAPFIKGFILESFDEVGNRVFSYTDSTSSHQRVYKITSESVNSSVSRVMIRMTGPMFLTICELEIYGDSLCEPEHYGRECEHKCNCARNEACFVSTGGCPSGCADGFQGENCNETCDPGTYGKNCNFKCSQFCQLPLNGSQDSSCDHVNGTCKHGCQTGYEGDYCLPASDKDNVLIIAATITGICLAVIIVVVVVIYCNRRRT